MAPPPSDPDWLEALRRPAPGALEEVRRAERRFTPPACSRCQRPAASLESWLERRRLRTLDARAPGGFRYAYDIREHRVCGPCYLEVRGGRPAVKTHALKTFALVVAGAALLAAAVPAMAPNLVAAFWRNGAAPAGWREGRPRHAVFVQGRY